MAGFHALGFRAVSNPALSIYQCLEKTCTRFWWTFDKVKCLHVFFFWVSLTLSLLEQLISWFACLFVWLFGWLVGLVGLVWFVGCLLWKWCFFLRLEILPWCELPAHLPAGTLVKATQHLLSPCAIIVQAGTKGTILGGVDSSLAFVSFEQGKIAVAAAMNTLEISDEKLESEVGMGNFLILWWGFWLWLGIK